MKPTDEQISAWLDGNLPPDEAEKLVAAVQGDADLKDRIDSMRNIDALVRKAVPLDETIPTELLERLGLGRGNPQGNVIAFAPRRASPSTLVPAMEDRFRRSGIWQIAAQVAMIACVGLVGALWLVPASREPENSYRALSASSSPSIASPTAIVLFDDDVTAAEARLIVERLGASIAGEQNAAGAWPLLVKPANREVILGALRQREDVLVAEPIDGG